MRTVHPHTVPHHATDLPNYEIFWVKETCRQNNYFLGIHRQKTTVAWYFHKKSFYFFRIPINKAHVNRQIENYNDNNQEKWNLCKNLEKCRIVNACCLPFHSVWYCSDLGFVRKCIFTNGSRWTLMSRQQLCWHNEAQLMTGRICMPNITLFITWR